MELKKLLRLAAAFGCAVALATAVQAQGVKVNGKTVPQNRIDAGLKNRIAQGQPDSPQLREAVKEALINQEIVAQEALKKGFDKNPEVVGLMEINRQEILVNAYLQDFLRSHPISDEALKKEYEHIKVQLGGKEYKAHHILLEKEDEAKEITTQIKNGANFEKLAEERSKDAGTKGRGGDLNWNVPANYVKPFADALAKLKKGQMTDAPVQSNFGWHVIRLDDERAFKPPAFEEVKANLQRGMQQQVIQKAVSDLRAKAKIE